MILQGKKHPRTPLDLEEWGRGYFKSGYSYGKNNYSGFAGFGIAPLIPVAIQAGTSIIGALFGAGRQSEAERQRLWMEFMQRQADAYNTKETLVYGVLPALAIIGGILLLRKK